MTSRRLPLAWFVLLGALAAVPSACAGLIGAEDPIELLGGDAGSDGATQAGDATTADADTGRVDSGVSLAISPPQWSFPAPAPGSSAAPAPQAFQVTNTGPEASPPLSASLLGAAGDFSITQSTCSAPLSRGQTCFVTIVAQPSPGGPWNALLQVGGAGEYAYAALYGSGSPLFTIQPTFHDFGSAPQGSNSAEFVFTIQNAASTTLTPLSIQLPSGPFAAGPTSTCGGPLAPGATCQIGIVFAPTSLGSFSGTLSVGPQTGAPTAQAMVIGNTGMLPPTGCYTGKPFTPLPWAPPTPLHQNKCTSSQITAFASSLNTAGPFTSGDATCDGCLMSDLGAAQYGAMIMRNGTPFLVNQGGCQADLDGNSSPGCCGQQDNDAFACFILECNTCSDWSMPTQSGPTTQCQNLAFSPNLACAGYSLNGPCTSEFSGVASACAAPGSIDSFFTLWCGP